MEENIFERKVRDFIKTYIVDEMSLQDYMYGYEMFNSFNDSSDNELLKSALAKILVETKIIVTEELHQIDLYNLNQRLLKYIDSSELELTLHSTTS